MSAPVPGGCFNLDFPREVVQVLDKLKFLPVSNLVGVFLILSSCDFLDFSQRFWSLLVDLCRPFLRSCLEEPPPANHMLQRLRHGPGTGETGVPAPLKHRKIGSWLMLECFARVATGWFAGALELRHALISAVNRRFLPVFCVV